MKTLHSFLRRFMFLTVTLLLSGLPFGAEAGQLFTDGDFNSQVIGQPVAAPWGPVGGGTITAAAQSPYTNVYPDNGKGANFFATGNNLYIVRGFDGNTIPADATATYYFNIDFRNNSGETGDYSIVITRDADGNARSVAFYVTGDTLYAESQGAVTPVKTLAQGTWYNLQLVLDMATKTYSGSLSTPTEFTPISSRPFIQSGQTINCVYTDGGTSVVGGPSPDHDMDNWAMSDTALTPLAGGPFVKSTAPQGAGWTPNTPIALVLEDRNTEVDLNAIELTVNGVNVTPVVNKPEGSMETTITYLPDGGWEPATYAVKLVFSDTATSPTTQTNEFTFQITDPLVASLVVNVDFNGLREGDVQGPTYEGMGAGGGGRIFNSIVANSILPGGGNDDNLSLSTANLLDSFGDVTAVGFTVSPMGGDVGWAPTTVAQSTAALFGDYIFNNSSGNTAGESPFQISGLGSVPFVDLYFYRTSGGVTIPGVSQTAFPGQGIFNPGNTYYFHRVPVVNGTVDGTFGSGTAVICGLSIVSPFPRPFIRSASPTGLGIQPDAVITIELEDYVTEVVTDSIQLLVNGTAVTPVIDKPEGSPITTVTYAEPGGFDQGSSNEYTIVFGDSATPSVVQSNTYTFDVLTEKTAEVTINIDFTGARYEPTSRGPGPTYSGQGAAGGGIVWNGLLADSRVSEGVNDDNITVTGDNLLNSVGNATGIGFTISPVGGDDNGAPAGTDPTSAAALFGDYIFVGAAGQLSGMADFTIGGLGTAPYVDLYFYFGANGNFTLSGGSAQPFVTTGIFTPGNTICYQKVPVIDGAVSGVFGAGSVSLLYGLSIQPPLPQPYVESYSPQVPAGAKPRISEIGPLQIVLRDYVTHVVPGSIQLALNGQAVSPEITQDGTAGSTTVSYDATSVLLLDATNTVRLVFSDDATPAVVQTLEYQFYVMSEATVARIINIDFDGLREGDVMGPTYQGVGAGGGGPIFNGLIANSIPADGGNDNLTVGAENLLNSIGDPTTVGFTIAPMGGDVGGTPTTDPTSPEALFSDYVFNNSAGNSAGESPFTISGLGNAQFVDLYFYHTFQTGWRVTIPGVSMTAFSSQGIFSPQNTYYFRRVPVTGGTVSGTFGTGTAVACGLTIVPSAPPPSLSIVREGDNIRVSWAGPGTLQSVDVLTGEWQDVSNATNPLIVVSPQGNKFYRLRP